MCGYIHLCCSKDRLTFTSLQNYCKCISSVHADHSNQECVGFLYFFYFCLFLDSFSRYYLFVFADSESESMKTESKNHPRAETSLSASSDSSPLRVALQKSNRFSSQQMPNLRSNNKSNSAFYEVSLPLVSARRRHYLKLLSSFYHHSSLFNKTLEYPT